MARDSTPNTMLLARVAPCYHLMLLYIRGDIWRARSEARSNTLQIYLSPLESEELVFFCIFCVELVYFNEPSGGVCISPSK